MKKIASFFLMAFAGFGLAVAQNFKVEIDGKVITEGATVEVSGVVDNEDVWDLKAYMVLTNTSESKMVFSGTASKEGLPEGSFVAFCGFGNCFGNSLPAHTMEPGEVRGEDHAEDALDIAYTPNTAYDEAVVAVTLNDETAGKSLHFNIKFIPKRPGDVTNEGLKEATIAAYPNPAVDQVNFRLDNVKAGSRVLLRDLTGKTVREANVNGLPEVTMSLTGLSSGMYFYCVEENGSNVAVGKLMVR